VKKKLSTPKKENRGGGKEKGKEATGPLRERNKTGKKSTRGGKDPFVAGDLDPNLLEKKCHPKGEATEEMVNKGPLHWGRNSRKKRLFW